ncbi:glycoside hydrolase family 3 protein [Guyanagaster necrorhizus]|uniref:beta-glucosidase n=1 Tax=Guyanagaster necrorhizus TaxID=856835 RepID=A0A9P7W6C6_9AGAR|nr:glycoside hydrolase family 3 protein [Guyanagaster necrorhizus MCA 3950]KAG7452963.1 glycoside hydrolase family 3 protein [Guyanagaster necrorhizus MCA 3950]
MAHPFLDADIADLVQKLRIDEKISLLGAPNWWNTTAIERLKIPPVRMSDGPNGVRGSSHFVAIPAQCLPCSTSLAATFDTELIYDAGIFLAQEAKIKSSVILLAPTCNIQRSPLGGRAFESFSEDPHLSGMMASAYVNGLQSEGVAATIKHFVANDQEHERTAADSVMSDRALREIYLYPFMLAQKHAQPWAYMTSYGRVRGLHCSENRQLLQGILRNEWDFDGIVISDWFGTYGVDEAINAGLDLEMPGPPRWRTQPLVSHCLTSQKVLPRVIDERVTTLLRFVQHQARRNPDVVYGDGKERSRDSPEARTFCRKLAADGIVLLKNQGHLLPLSAENVKHLAIIGPNAKSSVISGGGSAQLKATYVVTPYAGITAGAPSDVVVDYEVGCYAHKYLPTLEANLETSTSESGWLCTFYSCDEQGKLTEPIADFILRDTRVKLNDFLPAGLSSTWMIKLTGKLTMDKTGPYDLGLTVAGRAKLWVNGKLAIDNWTKQTPGDFFYGQGTIEEKATLDFEAGVGVDILVEYINTSPPKNGDEEDDMRSSQPALMRGVRLGGCERIDPDKAIDSAVSLASKVDAVVFFGGLTPEWESEGFDRPTLQLPGRQDEIITRIAEVNPNVIVCIQAGSAVSMPWADKVGGLLQSWYSGNEAGNAIADIVFGKVNPSGRLPLTLPVRLEDVPSFLNRHSEYGKIHYREDLFVGYKHYQAVGIQAQFPFGFGLSYTEFSMSNLSLSAATDVDVKVSVDVKNVGNKAGSQVVQLYVSYPDIGITQPPFQLRGFAKARNILPGSTRTVQISLNKYAFSFWDPSVNSWRVSVGKYGLHVGSSSEQLDFKVIVTVKKGFLWNGL